MMKVQQIKSMDPTIKAQWLEALRGDEYQQATGSIRDDGRFCCLGVLCDLAIKDEAGPDVKWGGAFGEALFVLTEYGDRDCEEDWTEHDDGDLPESVMRWAGLSKPNPIIDPQYASVDRDGSAIFANDDRHLTFSEIADLVEENL